MNTDTPHDSTECQITLPVSQVQWISARDRLPTQMDADDFGQVYWCGKEFVCRETPRKIQSWDWKSEHNLAGYWAKTGVICPAPPNTIPESTKVLKKTIDFR